MLRTRTGSQIYEVQVRSYLWGARWLKEWEHKPGTGELQWFVHPPYRTFTVFNLNQPRTQGYRTANPFLEQLNIYYFSSLNPLWLSLSPLSLPALLRS